MVRLARCRSSGRALPTSSGSKRAAQRESSALSDPLSHPSSLARRAGSSDGSSNIG